MFVILLTLLAFPPAACAYLDLTTGSYFFQIALGTILGLAVSFRARIKHAFWSIKNKCCPDKKTAGDKNEVDTEVDITEVDTNDQQSN